MPLTIKKYATKKTWRDFYSESEDNKLRDLDYHESWKPILKELLRDKRAKKIDDEFKTILEKEDRDIYPKPEYLFASFNKTPLENVKVVILGQDPYPGFEKCDDIEVPQAHGLSFSIPLGMRNTSSLINIFANMMKYKHINKVTDGNLEHWAEQGVLLLNAALTVTKGEMNSHKHLWNWMTDDIIKYISDNTKNVVFILWGAYARDKKKLINEDNHRIYISSHPSGQSCHRALGEYPPFSQFDHFGKINGYLRRRNIPQIIWNRDEYESSKT